MSKNNNLELFFQLHAFASSHTPPVICAHITYQQGRLGASFVLEDDGGIVLGRGHDQGRRLHHLWQQTCFEIFVAGQDSSYREYHLSPGGAWQCYQFYDYRSPFPPQEAPVEPPLIELDHPTYTLSFASDLPSSINVAAVILNDNGQVTFHSLKHSSGEPDFHLRQNFVDFAQDHRENS